MAKKVFETIPKAQRAIEHARMRVRKAFTELVFKKIAQRPATTVDLIAALRVKPGVVYRAVKELRETNRIEIERLRREASGVKYPTQKRRGPKSAVYEAAE